MRDFKLEVLTPEREFFKGRAEALTVELPDGQLTVLADHIPMVAVLKPGAMRVKREGTWRICFVSEGFMEVRPDEVLVYSQTCEYPDEIDRRRAQEALERAQERLRQRQSFIEHKATQATIARAMARLRVKGGK